MEDWRIEKAKEAIVRKLKTRVGEAFAISSEKLTEYLQANGFPEIDRRGTRDMVHDLRQAGTPICSKSGRGLYWPAGISDVFKTSDALNDTAKDLHYTAAQVKQGGINLFGAQGELPL